MREQIRPSLVTWRELMCVPVGCFGRSGEVLRVVDERELAIGFREFGVGRFSRLDRVELGLRGGEHVANRRFELARIGPQ